MLTLWCHPMSPLWGQEKLSCNPRKENGTHAVVCDMGNPMKAGTQVGGTVPSCPLLSPCVPSCHLTSPRAALQIAVAVELSVTGLEDAGDAITFHLQLRR